MGAGKAIGFIGKGIIAAGKKADDVAKVASKAESSASKMYNSAPKTYKSVGKSAGSAGVAASDAGARTAGEVASDVSSKAAEGAKQLWTKTPGSVKKAAVGVGVADVVTGGAVHRAVGAGVNAVGTVANGAADAAENMSNGLNDMDELKRRFESMDKSVFGLDAGLLVGGITANALGNGEGVLGVVGKVAALAGVAKTGYDLYEGLIADEPEAKQELAQYADDLEQSTPESSSSSVELDDEGKALQASIAEKSRDVDAHVAQMQASADGPQM